MSFKNPTTLISTALQPGWGSFNNVTCEVEPIMESAEMVRDWNGTLKNLADPLFQQYRVRVYSDDEMYPAALGGLWPGETLSIVAPLLLGGSVNRPVPSTFTLDGRTWRKYTFSNLMVVEPWRVSARERDKTVRWELTCEEFKHPSQ